MALCQTTSLCVEQVNIWTVVSASPLKAHGSPVSMSIHILGGLHSNLQIGDVFRNHNVYVLFSVLQFRVCLALLFYGITSYLKELSGNHISRSLHHNGDYCSRCIIPYAC